MVFNTIFTNSEQQFASSGNVGIGTTVMANKLDVNGSASIGTYANSAAPANGLIVSGSVGIGTTNPANLLALGPNGAAFPAPSGNAPLYAARAWVNFDGTTAGTNPALMTIRGSGNVSSVTRTGTGNFTITYSTAMPNANYAVCFTSQWYGILSASLSTGSCAVLSVSHTTSGSFVGVNTANNCIIIIG